MIRPNGECVMPKCDFEVKSRGLCVYCYNAVAQLVRVGGFNWDIAVAMGFGKEAKKHKWKREVDV